jgi:hypothetical protein
MFRRSAARRGALSGAPRSFRPLLEELESRFCPSSLSLNATAVSENMVQFSGQYTGASQVVGQAVVITGQGWSTTTWTNSQGRYGVTNPVRQFGNVTATVQADPSATATVNVNYAAPQITNFVALQAPNGMWEFKGTVLNTPDPQGMTVCFSGIPSLTGDTTSLAADGTFDVAFYLGNQQGVAQAQTQDWWGQWSNIAQSMV